MCEPEENFVTIVGRRDDLEALVGNWEMLNKGLLHDLDRPEVARLEDLHTAFAEFTGRGRRYNPNAPGVARVRRTPGTPTANGYGFAGRLQAEIAVQLPSLGLLVEPGFLLSVSGGGAGGGGGPPIVSLNPPAVAVTAAARGPLPPAAGGHRVAVLDTGHQGAPGVTQMVDMIGGQPLSGWPAQDTHGHGTSIHDLIAHVAAARGVNVSLEPVRVVQQNLTTSYEMLCGLAYALWSGSFDLVNASLSANVPGGCPTMLGTSMEFILTICRSSGRTTPTIVAAAGNTNTNQRFGYPAQLTGVVVVQAWDSPGNPASYNVPVPGGVQPVWALGGDDPSKHRTATARSGTVQTFGQITRGGVVEEMYGTSYAAALVTGWLLP